MLYLGDFPINSTIRIPFQTFNSSGASVTLTGLAVTDIEIYKNGSTTQRASDVGYTLLDTDGIDFDGITGIHGFSIDTSDNTDAGFFVAAADYWVVVSAVTVDSQTVNFVAAIFSIENRKITANLTQIASSSITADGPVPHLGIADQGTLQSISSTGAVIRAGASFGDNTLYGMVIGIYGSTQGYWQYKLIIANTGTTIVFDTIAVIPSGTLTYRIFGSPSASESDPATSDLTHIMGTALTEGATGRLAAALVKFLNVATPTGTINSLPDAVPGASGGLVIAGSNAAVTFDTFTCTGAFSIGGTSNVAQTGDSFGRIGANGAGLTGLPWNGAWDVEVQSEVADALAAYDPPTNAEMEARTLAAASYATSASLSTVAANIVIIGGIVASVQTQTDKLAFTNNASVNYLKVDLHGLVGAFMINSSSRFPGL